MSRGKIVQRQREKKTEGGRRWEQSKNKPSEMPFFFFLESSISWNKCSCSETTAPLVSDHTDSGLLPLGDTHIIFHQNDALSVRFSLIYHPLCHLEKDRWRCLHTARLRGLMTFEISSWHRAHLLLPSSCSGPSQPSDLHSHLFRLIN